MPIAENHTFWFTADLLAHLPDEAIEEAIALFIDKAGDDGRRARWALHIILHEEQQRRASGTGGRRDRKIGGDDWTNLDIAQAITMTIRYGDEVEHTSTKALLNCLHREFSLIAADRLAHSD